MLPATEANIPDASEANGNVSTNLMALLQKVQILQINEICAGGGGVKKAAQAFKKPLGNKKEERLQKYERK